MRAARQPDEIRERYLGEIAPLLAAARPVESLSAERRKKLRRRILRTLFGTRHVAVPARLVPVLAALALLIIGGAAFATAQHLGLLPQLGRKEAVVPDREVAPEARRGKSRARAGSASAAIEPRVAFPAVAPAPPAIALPVMPDPLLASAPAGGMLTWPLPTAPGADVESPRARSAVVVSAKPQRIPGRVAMSSSSLDDRAAVEQLARVPAPIMRAPSMAAGGPGPAAPFSAALDPAVATAPAPTVATMPASELAAPWAAKVAAPVPAALPPAEKPQPSSDQALFGQALRKLRQEHDATAALARLREHAKVYPKSAFAGERAVLEVEALLALHRDREALALLDGMALDELPRSGERCVVRGELRAAARRWQEANADFDRALARVSGSPTWYERALWGRGVARLRLGEREAGLADLERYRDLYPRGRFAAEAAKFFSGQ